MARETPEELLRNLEAFNASFHSWSGSSTNPWEKTYPYRLKSGVIFPSSKGVYMFHSNDNHSSYYIGKASSGLRKRLTDKLYKDRDDDWPYLPQYCEDATTVFFLETRRFDAKLAERILISAAIAGGAPIHNDTGTPAFAKLQDVRGQELLEEIAEKFQIT
jgi:hypothetical protein